MPDTLAPTSAPTGDTTELWYTRCPVPTATGIALDQGWLGGEFGRTGIDLKSLADAPDPAVRLSHFHHRLPGLFREGGNIPAIWAKSLGQDTAVVALTWVDETQVLLTRPDGGIRGPADLKGRRLGLPKRGGEAIDFARAMALHGYVSALRLAGLTTGDVTLVDVPAPPTEFRRGDSRGPWRDPTFDALLAGTIDAVYIKGAAAVSLRRQHGLQVVVDLNAVDDPAARINNGTPRPVTVNRNLAENRPDLVARYLAVLSATADWATDHAEDVRRIVAAETSTDVASVLDAYGPELHLRLKPRLPPDWIAAFETQKNFLRDRGFLAGDVDVAAWINPEPLAEAERLLAQGAVTLPV
ncbi:MAG: ABC transporter substrate-binding protein [Azospirillaceae bacterium]|nr:ABC transporter substrate-binding protein [Azospirillaceae bacterium]